MVATTSTSSTSDTGSLGPLGPDPHRVAFAAPAPPSSKRQDRDYAVVKLFPSELRFVTGIARAYDDDFPPELSHLVLCPSKLWLLPCCCVQLDSLMLVVRVLADPARGL